ncbi:MAG: hypothetical protein OES24_22835, partial [Acidimicrobiia bacterium]|nr:hypothetical protein [Acidimicrobiia bacterium]
MTVIDRTATSHPLDRLTEDETTAAVGIVKADERFGPRMRFGSVNLSPPPKAVVINHTPGADFERAVDV